jgi:small subunit ribosomal protein S6
MNKYQLLFIIENSLSDEAKAALVDKFNDLIVSLGGNVSAVEKWGTRTFAYPINYKTEGYYVLITFEANPEVPAEVDRQMRINDGIIRQMITKKD